VIGFLLEPTAISRQKTVRNLEKDLYEESDWSVAYLFQSSKFHSAESDKTFLSFLKNILSIT
jgi:hypothetical protein